MAEGVLMTDLKQHFAEARSWEQDARRKEIKSRRLAWTICGVSLVLNVVAVGAIAALTPLKTVEPFVITVDRSTGATEVTTALTGDKNVTYNEAVSKYFLAQYVRVRESWVPAAAAENFNSVAILSQPKEQTRYQTYFDRKNPASPQVLYGPRAVVEASVRSITFVNAKVAQVRFTRTVRPDVGDVIATNWLATITFDFTTAPMSEGDRFRNPLGFQVSTYRIDPEVVQ
ncbi:type IV secretion system protein VirB8 [Sphingomonas sp. BK036]|nr:type IV secretion system protein VirB8 [Sphingomonas sp. BK036]